MNVWARVILRRRWTILLGTIALVLIAGAWGSTVMNKLGAGGYSDPGSESMQVERIVQEHFGRQTPDAVAVYTVPDGRTLDDIGDDISRSLDSIDPALLDRPVLTYWNTPAAAPYLRSHDGTQALAVVFAAGDENERIAAFDEIEPHLRVPGVDTDVTGFTALATAINDQSERDLVFAESLSLPVTLAVLVLVFGGLVAASLPVLVGVLSVLGALASLRLISEFVDVNVFAVNIASLLGLGLAIDYGLFIVSRFREELAREGADTPTAIARTLATAGRTVAFSALLLMCAFAGTLVFPQSMLKSLGFGAMSAVAVAAAMSLTVLPAALALLGHRISTWSWRTGAFEHGEARAQRFWGTVTSAVLRRPGVIAAAIITALLLLAAPVTGIKLGDVDHTALPPGSSARIGAETVAAAFPAANSGVLILATGTDDTTPPSDAIAALRSAVAAVDGVTNVAVVGANEAITVLQAQLSVPDRSQAAMAAVEDIRGLPTPDGVDLQIGGLSAITADGVDAIIDWLPVMIAIMAGATLLLMLLAFGSIVLPLKAIAVAFLSLGATFGILTLIFFDGHLSHLLGVSEGPLAAGMVVLVISVVFGLSTDYEVFLISRMVEAKHAGASTDEAILIGATRTGRVVTAAATLLILVTGAFTLSELTPMRFIGIGMIIALALDATLVRMLLVPALVTLMGNANWWGPAFLRTPAAPAALPTTVTVQ
ncbi:MMPL family transporter [Rhodococcus erythropolis]|uniref:MMPL family transporter n=1 Tax=Rhodococcus erythropolis TaxID=1833 RepID=UPI001E4DB639|nr:MULTISPECIES: MMPL family transporter [Rhodococcus erythropolis group]MCD2104322.1 MMPL family transporter [Rhodococcus qingshengii]MCZ4523377.1 MMPL family transporter [Rhodococcus erythropolis]